MHVRAFVKGAALGAAAAYLFDPESGNGRRARLQDQAGALLRRGRERADDLSRHAGNVVGGRLRGLTTTDASRSMDDATVADRIRSEVLGGKDLREADVVVNVEEGTAHLRGQAPDQDTIDGIVERTRTVAGVREVENLIHLPEAPAPNKKAARAVGDGPAA